MKKKQVHLLKLDDKSKMGTKRKFSLVAEIIVVFSVETPVFSVSFRSKHVSSPGGIKYSRNDMSGKNLSAFVKAYF